MKTLATDSLALVACAALAAPAFAQAPSDSEDTCKVPREVSQSFKVETDFKDLLTWTMSFTCKNFILDPRTVARAKPLTIVAPTAMSPDDAYNLFLHALDTMTLTVVPKGNALRLVDSTLARPDTITALWHRTAPSARPHHVVLTATKPSASEPMTFQISVKR